MINHKTFLERAIKTHGDKYDYSKSRYEGALTKLTITCKKHGDFEQTPASHWRGVGCFTCGGKAKLTIDEFVARSRQVHGDKYDYSRSHYKGNLKKLTIICPEHGEFEQEAASHWKGRGCKKCVGLEMNLEDFIEKSMVVHSTKYNYKKSIYRNSQTELEIICPKHGSFHQTPNNHLRGTGCPTCWQESRFLTQEEFLEKACAIHGDNYDYSQAVYVDAMTKVMIGCKKHGFFDQLPLGHLYIKTGCPACKESKGERKIRSWLVARNIPFDSQAKLPGCQDRKPLRFDFLVNGIAIEFYGEHHYNPVGFGSRNSDPKEMFEGVQRRDKIKREFCAANGINLIEIAHWDFDKIEEILAQKIA